MGCPYLSGWSTGSQTPTTIGPCRDLSPRRGFFKWGYVATGCSGRKQANSPRCPDQDTRGRMIGRWTNHPMLGMEPGFFCNLRLIRSLGRQSADFQRHPHRHPDQSRHLGTGRLVSDALFAMTISPRFVRHAGNTETLRRMISRYRSASARGCKRRGSK